MQRASVFLASLLFAGCASHPPARWAQGGATLVLARAHWERGGDPVDLMPDGKVLVGGEHVYTLDAAGRVSEPDKDPVAMLYPSGHLVGPDEQALGFVGVASASLPGASTAWIMIAPNEVVVTYDDDGASRPGGYWQGCQGQTFRTCTLVTHLIGYREYTRRPRMSVGVGIGIGIGR